MENHTTRGCDVAHYGAAGALLWMQARGLARMCVLWSGPARKTTRAQPPVGPPPKEEAVGFGLIVSWVEAEA